MVWACDEARGNKSSKSIVMKTNVEGKIGSRGRQKKEMVGYY